MSSTTVIDPSRPEGAAPKPALPLSLYALVFPSMLYLVLVGIVLNVGLRLTHGHFTYALDDTYIHMALAKNLAAHGLFGVTSHEFTSASSSILWPFLLAAIFKIVGPIAIVPFIAQIVISIALLWLSWRTLQQTGVSSNWYAGYVLGAIVIVVPMVTMTFVAMEHLLHAFATLLFATTALACLYRARPAILATLLSAAFLCSVRYEGAFLVAAVALLFVIEKRFFAALAISISGAMPILLFGLYSRAHGAFFLPNSLLLKKHQFSLVRLFTLITDTPEIFILAAAALLLLAFGTTTNRTARGLLKLFLLSALIHQLLARYGWFYRYEAYLITFGLVAIAAAAHNIFDSPARRVWIAATVFLLATPLLVRGVKSFADTPSAMADIYHQQIQMADFFRTYYPGGRIALNDIGAVSFYADPYLTDVYGLGSTEVTRIRVAHHSAGSDTSTTLLPAVHKDLFRLIQQNGVEVAAVYDLWFGFKDGDTPPGWIKVGTWTVPETTVLGSQTVSFYGVGPENAARLKANLARFHSSLPPEIQPFAAP